MELWIRSQDKERLMKATDLRIYYAKEEDIWVIEDCDDLGYYKTKERALEVLGEIQNILKPITIFKNVEINKETWEEIQKFGVCTINDRVDVTKLDTFVYEMPEE